MQSKELLELRGRGHRLVSRTEAAFVLRDRPPRRAEDTLEESKAASKCAGAVHIWRDFSFVVRAPALAAHLRLLPHSSRSHTPLSVPSPHLRTGATSTKRASDRRSSVGRSNILRPTLTRQFELHSIITTVLCGDGWITWPASQKHTSDESCSGILDSPDSQSKVWSRRWLALAGHAFSVQPTRYSG
ncbi:hypothetical protein EIP86_009256 [Pleurotus ostreatoroseus]|nr:hypothetical protein EIP86_009256 [Pleurotus ostreatoroseus]